MPRSYDRFPSEDWLYRLFKPKTTRCSCALCKCYIQKPTVWGPFCEFCSGRCTLNWGYIASSDAHQDHDMCELSLRLLMNELAE